MIVLLCHAYWCDATKFVWYELCVIMQTQLFAPWAPNHQILPSPSNWPNSFVNTSHITYVSWLNPSNTQIPNNAPNAYLTWPFFQFKPSHDQMLPKATNSPNSCSNTSHMIFMLCPNPPFPQIHIRPPYDLPTCQVSHFRRRTSQNPNLRPKRPWCCPYTS